MTSHDVRGSSGGSIDSRRSWRSKSSDLSVLSAGSDLSVLSAGSILSIGSAGSILSIGSAGSILSIGSAGSILSVRSVGSILGRGTDRRDGQDRPAATSLVGTVATALALAATIAAMLDR